MPQHPSIRNAPQVIPSLPFEIMEDIFQKCGAEVPTVNTHALFVKNKHKSAMRIQACFKGALARHWVSWGNSRIWEAVNEFHLSDAHYHAFGNHFWNYSEEGHGGPDPTDPGRVKIETVEHLHGRPFGGVRVTFHYHQFLRFHITVPGANDTIQLDNYVRHCLTYCL